MLGECGATSLGCHLYTAPGDKWALLSLSSLQQGAVGKPMGFGTVAAAAWGPLHGSGRQETCGASGRKRGTVTSRLLVLHTWCLVGALGFVCCTKHLLPQLICRQQCWQGGSLRQRRRLGQSAGTTQLNPCSQFILGRVSGFP